jgi:nucleotide-binding universal stress UspA family protein
MVKDLIVHLDGSPADETCIEQAESIASAFEAHLTGLFTNSLPDYGMLTPMDGWAAAAYVLADLEQEALRTGDATEQRLSLRFKQLGVTNEVRRLDAMPSELASRTAEEARLADLFVMARPSKETAADDEVRDTMVLESVLFESGRGILVVPPQRLVSAGIRRVLVCWRDTRETARAIGEAIPFIAKSTETVVLIVDPEGRSACRTGRTAPGTDVARHLERHGAGVSVVVRESAGRAVSDVILDQARRMSADLIVLGGYGHSRLREWVLGGVTADLLNGSEFPLLMAH